MKYAWMVLCSVAALTAAAEQVKSELQLELLQDEVWWGGAVTLGVQMPYGKQPLSINLDGDNRGNQYAPLLLSSKGRYIWSEKAFAFTFKDKALDVRVPQQVIHYGQAGATLRSAYQYAAKNYFPSDGKLPDLALFAAPQYNTWIELTYNQNQDDVLKYAQAILDKGFPPGVLMIDDTWQEAYGVWNFHPGRFHDPKAMMDKLHQMGFKVMLWVCPFVSADSVPYRMLAKKKAFFRTAAGAPAMVTWWNGQSAMLDLSNPVDKAWFDGELARLQKDFGVDGFKLDAGDTIFYTSEYAAYDKTLDVNEHTMKFGEVGLNFPLNEYRACFKLAGRPLVQRLRDKNHNWADVAKLIPDMIAAGLLGYTFVCPDMIGGGEYQSFLDLKTMDQELVVRSAQAHALAPMMQFSVAPWRVLDAAHFAAVKRAVEIRMRYTPQILELAKAAAKSGEPMLRPLAYPYPEQGYECIRDQFMLGDTLMVAPMTVKGNSRTVVIPPGTWRSDLGEVIEGPKQLTVEVPLARLPYFEKCP